MNMEIGNMFKKFGNSLGGEFELKENKRKKKKRLEEKLVRLRRELRELEGNLNMPFEGFERPSPGSRNVSDAMKEEIAGTEAELVRLN